MIPQAELFRLAHRAGVGERIIEKDYVLSWLLIAIAQSGLGESVAFKGGTALKKIYFPDYRFSEDLDFTLIGTLSHDDLVLSLEGLLPSLLDRVNLRVELDTAELTAFETTSVQVSYVGPLQARMGSRSLKMDFTRGELLVNQPKMKELKAPYSDYASVAISAYTKREILAEKLCALMGRTEPRDLYDAWWLLEESTMDPVLLSHDFAVKADHKGHSAARLDEALEAKSARFERQWRTRLSGQVTDLPYFDEVMRAVRRHARRLALEQSITGT
jgi:predicted nucleotidyltransferase component of viral defense system